MAGKPEQPGLKLPEIIGKAREFGRKPWLDASAPSLYTSGHPIQVEWTIAVRLRAAAILRN
jgi:hypothetical protein